MSEPKTTDRDALKSRKDWASRKNPEFDSLPLESWAEAEPPDYLPKPTTKIADQEQTTPQRTDRPPTDRKGVLDRLTAGAGETEGARDG